MKTVWKGATKGVIIARLKKDEFLMNDCFSLISEWTAEDKYILGSMISTGSSSETELFSGFYSKVEKSFWLIKYMLYYKRLVYNYIFDQIDEYRDSVERL